MSDNHCPKKHPSHIIVRITNLPAAQTGLERSVCAACAYELGYREGFAKARADQEADSP